MLHLIQTCTASNLVTRANCLDELPTNPALVTLAIGVAVLAVLARAFARML